MGEMTNIRIDVAGSFFLQRYYTTLTSPLIDLIGQQL